LRHALLSGASAHTAGQLDMIKVPGANETGYRPNSVIGQKVH